MVSQTKLPKEFCNLKFEEPIRCWDEALPLGNGLLGALLWGESGSFRMSMFAKGKRKGQK